MSDERTFTARLACPTCGVPGPRLVVAVDARRARDCRSGPPLEPGWEMRVHDCMACWRLRAQALAIARERLRAAGDLGETSNHRPTWQGAIVREEGHDPITGALASELMRLGVRPVDGSRVRLTEAALGLGTRVQAA